MYEGLIKEYLKRLSIKDINNFANNNNLKLKNNEDQILYDFIINNWKEFYKGDRTKVLKELQGKISPETYNFIINLYDKYKNKII